MWAKHGQMDASLILCDVWTASSNVSKQCCMLSRIQLCTDCADHKSRGFLTMPNGKYTLETPQCWNILKGCKNDGKSSGSAFHNFLRFTAQYSRVDRGYYIERSNWWHWNCMHLLGYTPRNHIPRGSSNSAISFIASCEYMNILQVSAGLGGWARHPVHAKEHWSEFKAADECRFWLYRLVRRQRDRHREKQDKTFAYFCYLCLPTDVASISQKCTSFRPSQSLAKWKRPQVILLRRGNLSAMNDAKCAYLCHSLHPCTSCSKTETSRCCVDAWVQKVLVCSRIFSTFFGKRLWDLVTAVF